MANAKDVGDKKSIYIYVKFFRHYRTKKLVFPKPPHTHIRLKISAEKAKAYQERKRRKNARKKSTRKAA